MARYTVGVFALFFLLTASVGSLSGQFHAAPPPPVGGISVDQIIALTRSGLGDETIIAQIGARPTPLLVTTDDIARLKSARVSDAIIQAVLVSGSGAEINEPKPVVAAMHADGNVASPRAPERAAASSPGLAVTVLPSNSAASPNAPIAKPPSADGKIRLYVTDRPITEVISMIRAGSEGNAHASGYAYGGTASYSASAHEASYVGGISNDNRGGADPRTLEVSADILQDCHLPTLVITNNPAVADYVLDFRRQGGKRSTFFVFGGLTGLALSSTLKVDHAALYTASGDLVDATKARTVGGAVREVCAHFRSMP